MSSSVWPKPRAGDYALRFRTELKGGDVAYDLWRDDVENFKHEQRLILFIHGYADPVPAANEVYDIFEDRMDCCFSRKRAWTEGAPIVRVYWPGDVDWLGPLSYLGYPVTVYAAERCAQQFALALARMGECNPAMTIKVVVHSLGNHLLLRALSILNEENLPRPNIEHVLMMAAAVPTWRLERMGDDLKLGLDEATKENPARSNTGVAVTSIYSPSDFVLISAFPLGETIDWELDGVSPVALGHEHWYGQPSSMSLHQDLASPAPGVKTVDHTHYWTGLSVEQVWGALGIIEASTRSTLHRGASSRQTPTQNGIDARETPRRDTSSRS